MKSEARVVVIGGGIAGCSALYHLTVEGWSDCVLLERDELTSGTTWHSAAQVTNFGPNQTMIGLKSHSIQLYKDLAADPEYPVGYHHGDGGLRLASQQWHMDGYHHFISMAKGMGVDLELLDPAECKRRHPLIETDGLLGALWDPEDGDIDPAQLCQALVRRARKAGAEVYRKTPVTHIRETRNGWIVETPGGSILCEHVVNAGGYRCNEIAAMMQVELPVASMEHQYFVTEEIAAVRDLGHRVPLLRCPTDDFYQRQEKNGLLIGFYEQDCRTWGLDGIDPNFSMDLCPDDLDRVADVMEGAFARLPCLTEAGIHTIVNGPITYTPDGLPLVGRVPGRRNAWCITGLRAGLGEGGGHGWLLAQQIVHGQACYDTWCLDPRRFSRYASVEYTALKAVEDYQNEFRFHRPHEARPAGRLARTSPLYDRLAAQNARFAPVSGWERAAVYAPDADFVEDHAFTFTNAFDLVAAEVDAVQNAVGLAEMCGFSRIEIRGGGARGWVDGLICGRMPERIGKIGLGYTLTERGNLLSEATLAILGDDHLWWGAAAASQHHDMDWLLAQNPPPDVSLTCLTEGWTALVVAGPRAEALLTRIAPRTNWTAAAFPWLTLQNVSIGPVKCIAMSVSFSGERAWELHVPNEGLILVHQQVCTAGADLGLRPFGLYAIDSMRIEKGYRHWKADLIDEVTPFEAGLDRFVDPSKTFIGKSALMAQEASGRRRAFVTLDIDRLDAPAHPGDSILHKGEVVGTVTSAAWGHRTRTNLALALVNPAIARPGTAVDVQILGQSNPARAIDPCPYDPANHRVRSKLA